MGDASLPHPRVHNLVTRHSKKRTLSPHFASVCRCAVSLSSFSLLSLRVLGVSMSERADTHPAPSLNADPPLSFRTHSRHSEAFQGLGANDLGGTSGGSEPVDIIQTESHGHGQGYTGFFLVLIYYCNVWVLWYLVLYNDIYDNCIPIVHAISILSVLRSRFIITYYLGGMHQGLVIC